MTKSLSFLPPVIAHRGASAYAPENTMAAFVKAAQMGAKWVEFDVMLSADGTPIIFHDELLDRTSNGWGDPGQFDYAYLRTLDAGSWFDYPFAGERIPDLLTVVNFLRSMKMSANIEIKPLPGQETQLVKTVLQQMQPFLQDQQSTFLFSSFSIDALRLLRKNSSSCLMGLLMHEWLSDWQVICDDLNCVSVHLNSEIVSPHGVKKIKDTGRAVLSYTVNSPQQALEFYSWGVAAVFTDVPDRILAVLPPQKRFTGA